MSPGQGAASLKPRHPRRVRQLPRLVLGGEPLRQAPRDLVPQGRVRDAVERGHVWQHPVERYVGLLRELSVHPNPEVGHYVQRAWGAIFAPFGDECVHPELP